MKAKLLSTIGLVMALLFVACTPKKVAKEKTNKNEFAENFEIISSEDSVLIKVYYPHNNEWQTLGFSKNKLPQKIAISNTVQWAFINELKQGHKVTGVSGHSYFCDSTIHQNINDGKIIELANPDGLDIEQLITSKSELLLIDGFGRQNEKLHAAAKQFGIKILPLYEWTEKHPLARLEWIKVVGEILGENSLAQEIFNSRKSTYQKTKIEYKNYSKQTVMCAVPFKSDWYIPAKNSYMDILISDAGGVVLGAKEDLHVSTKLNLEEAYLAFANADVWLANGSLENSKDLADAVPFYNQLKAVKNNQVYNYHNWKQFGNYQFWEQGVVHPEWLLEDIATILHEQKNGRFYKRVL